MRHLTMQACRAMPRERCHHPSGKPPGAHTIRHASLNTILHREKKTTTRLCSVPATTPSCPMPRTAVHSDVLPDANYLCTHLCRGDMRRWSQMSLLTPPAGLEACGVDIFCTSGFQSACRIPGDLSPVSYLRMCAQAHLAWDRIRQCNHALAAHAVFTVTEPQRVLPLSHSRAMAYDSQISFPRSSTHSAGTPSSLYPETHRKQGRPRCVGTVCSRSPCPMLQSPSAWHPPARKSLPGPMKASALPARAIPLLPQIKHNATTEVRMTCFIPNSVDI